MPNAAARNYCGAFFGKWVSTSKSPFSILVPSNMSFKMSSLGFYYENEMWCRDLPKPGSEPVHFNQPHLSPGNMRPRFKPCRERNGGDAAWNAILQFQLRPLILTFDIFRELLTKCHSRNPACS